ncbi:MAG: hypothetical protein JWO86_3968 [Myxococcaceae bacterium]|nr:hypothetical protein [Myxococcaceae bacterium]MEA2746422.1 hypothetical protein [Myxococcales bacterium]
MRSSRPAGLFRLASFAVLPAVACASLVVACSSSGGSSSGDGRTGTETPDAAPEASAADSGGTKALGDTCTVDGDCASGHCLSQGTGMDAGGGGGGGGGDGGTGARKGSFCSVACATVNQSPAPECSDPVFTGKCGGKLLCQIK